METTGGQWGGGGQRGNVTQIYTQSELPPQAKNEKVSAMQLSAQFTSQKSLLVSTHIVCKRLSVMQEQARLREFCAKNSSSAPAHVFA